MKKIKGQLYIGATFIIILLLFYVYTTNTTTNTVVQNKNIEDTILSNVASGYNLSCKNIESLVKLISNIKWSYVVFYELEKFPAMEKCDPYNLINIQIRDGRYEVYYDNTSMAQVEVEDIKKILIFFISPSEEKYIKVYSLK